MESIHHIYHSRHLRRECKIFNWVLKKSKWARYILAEKKNNANTAALDVRTPNVTFYTGCDLRCWPPIYGWPIKAHLDIIQLIEFSEGVLLNLIGVLGLIGNTISITILSRWEKKIKGQFSPENLLSKLINSCSDSSYCVSSSISVGRSFISFLHCLLLHLHHISNVICIIFSIFM